MKIFSTRLLAAAFISEFGTALTTAALPVFFLRNGHADGAGLYNGFSAIGSLIGSVWVLGYVDRFRKNRIAVFSDIGRGLLLVPVIFFGKGSFESILVYSILNSILGTATYTAISGWIGEHYQTNEGLMKANSSLEIGSQTARAIAPPIAAGLLLITSVSAIFAIDAITYFIGAILVFNLSSKANERSTSNFITDVRQGFRFVASKPALFGIIGFSCLQSFGLAMINTAYLMILKDTIGASDSSISLFQSAYFIGAILAGGSGLVLATQPKTRLRSSGIVLVIVMIGSIYTQNYLIFFGLAIIQKFGTILGALGTRTLAQRLAGANFSGRVMAIRSLSIDLADVFSYGIALLLFQSASVSIMLSCGAVAFLFSILVGETLGDISK